MKSISKNVPPAPLECLSYLLPTEPLSEYEIQFAKNAWESYDNSGEQECGPNTHEERVLINFSKEVIGKLEAEISRLRSAIDESLDRESVTHRRLISCFKKYNLLAREKS